MSSRISAGDRFGRWTVLEDYRVTEKGEKKWHCRCECGTERYVVERSLVHGGSLSCGCLRKERATEAMFNDLTGKTFGELTVIKRLDNGKNHIRWLCRCSCGEKYEVSGYLLTTGRRTHCGSRKHEKNYPYTDITGQKFGMLTAMYPSKRYDRSGSVIWRCRCDCGNEVDVSYNALTYTNHKSCGCRKKEHNQKLKNYLTHVAGTSVDSIKSKKVPTDNTTGYKGVYYIRGKYTAKIVFQKKAYYLGSFDDIEDAAQARKEAEELLFDGVAEYYQQWESRAEKDPEWAEQNPVQIFVSQNSDKTISVTILPELSIKYDKAGT